MREWRFERIDSPDDSSARRLASVLYEAMIDWPDSYRSESDALREARLLGQDDRFAIGAFAGADIVGWIGAVMHDHLMWELHPLCVHPSMHGRGLGRALVDALESTARDADVNVLWLGTEDESGATNLFGQDLYPEPAARLADLRVLRPHPIAFYQRLGYVLCGVLPDSSGPGKHNFLMVKRLRAARGRDDEMRDDDGD